MIADVPLGVFLSGGIDSSAVVALMQAQSDRPVKSFTIGFTEAGYDEARHAKHIAAHLGTDHTELYVSAERTMAVLPQLASWFDEPFADSSQVPTYLISEMTRRHATVVLSGDGGDELFAGYNRHIIAATLWRRIETWPRPLRAAIASVARRSSLYLGPPVPGNASLNSAPTDRGQGDKLAAILSLADQEALYRRLVSQWQEPDAQVRGGREPRGHLWDPTIRRDFSDFTDRMQFLDTLTYLPDDILTKVDRASMAWAWRRGCRCSITAWWSSLGVCRSP